MSRSMLMVAALLLPIASSVSAQSSDPPAMTLWLKGNGLSLKTSIYESDSLSSRPVLIVVLHGDALGLWNVPPTTYHYEFANEAAKKIDDAVLTAVLRPGYRDHTGERSEGDLGLATGDNYTPEVVDAIADVIEQLKKRFHPSYTVLVGHSGGAAITGNLLGRRSSVVDGALLVSCPCDLVEWRNHMMKAQSNNPIWSKPIHALSPQELAPNVSPDALVSLLVGARDDVTPPSMSKDYADVLTKRVNTVTLTIAPEVGHELLLEPVAYDALARLVDNLRRANNKSRGDH